MVESHLQTIRAGQRGLERELTCAQQSCTPWSVGYPQPPWGCAEAVAGPGAEDDCLGPQSGTCVDLCRMSFLMFVSLGSNGLAIEGCPYMA